MTDEQRAALIMSQAVSAFVEALGMMSDNLQRQATGSSMAYDLQAFLDVSEKHGLGYNTVVGFLTGHE
jgi:hypothetical protein